MQTPSVLTVGNFDGVHLGHRAILAQAKQVAGDCGARVVAVTFDPHPVSVLKPGVIVPMLCELDERGGLLKAAGADHVHVIESTSRLLAEPPDVFVRWLCEKFSPVAFVEGEDFRFGKDRVGDVHTLESLGRECGFDTVITPAKQRTLTYQLVTRVSSSLTRWLLRAGRVADAALCLDRPYELAAKVVVGDRRGRKIGFSTANLDNETIDGLVVPANAVYAGYVALPDGATRPAAISIGVKPTFGGDHQCVEAHLLDFDADIYGQVISVRFGRWLRDQQKFPDLDALIAQLHRDVDKTRRLHDAGLLNGPADERTALAG